MAERGATFLRPDRKDEKPRFGSLGSVRQRVESVFWTCKGQLGLERATAPAPCRASSPASGCGSWLSPQASGTTGRSTSRGGGSPPTPTD